MDNSFLCTLKKKVKKNSSYNGVLIDFFKMGIIGRKRVVEIFCLFLSVVSVRWQNEWVRNRHKKRIQKMSTDHLFYSPNLHHQNRILSIHMSLIPPFFQKTRYKSHLLSMKSSVTWDEDSLITKNFYDISANTSQLWAPL